MPTRDRLDFLTDNWRAIRPDMDITPWQIWGRTTRLNEIFVSRITRSLREHGLTFTEFQTLGALVLAGPPYRANPNQIAQFNLLTSGGLANLLGRMEREGLIGRSPDPIDKRGVVVELTARGLQAFNNAVLEENRMEHELLGSLTLEERSILGLLLRKLLLGVDPFPVGDRSLPELVAPLRQSPAPKPGGPRRIPKRRTAPKLASRTKGA